MKMEDLDKFENKKIKVLFLDIDGVLNSEKYDVSLFEEKTETLLSWYAKEIDSNALSILANFINEFDLKVVLSSTWRKTKSRITFLKQLLNKYGIELYDATPVLHYEENVSYSIPRGCEIYIWLQTHTKNIVEDYIIFDDDSDMLLDQKEHFFEINNKYGLTEEDINKAKKYLKRDRI